MARRDELRDELVIMLRTSRELAPDTDEQLAELFLDRLEGGKLRSHTTSPARPRRRARRRPRGSHRSGDLRRKLAAFLVAGVALLIGTPISLHANDRYAGQGSQRICTTTQWAKLYPSARALKAGRGEMYRSGWQIESSGPVYGAKNPHKVFVVWARTYCSVR